MGAEDAKNVEVATECVPEAPVVVEKEDEKLALVPVEPCVPEEKPAEEKHGDDTKALVVVESKLISYILNLPSLLVKIYVVLW